MIVEHFGKDTQHGGFVLVDRAFDVDVEQNGFGLATGGTVDQHKGGGIVCEFLTESLNSGDSVDGFVFQDIGQHF